MKRILLAVFFISNILYSQEKIIDTVQGTKQNLDEVIVKGIRAKFSSPISYSNIYKEKLKNKNLGQDLPILLNFLPSVVTTSDAGAGIGYTGIRVRGVSPQSTNITINGIPFNDPESMGTFWVNLPDFTSSIQSLQLQRGIGTSTNGSGAFGASINISTDNISQTPYAEISSSFGSFNTRKNTIKFSTGKINDVFEFSGRFSKIDSDGYVDRAYSDLKSYFIQGTYLKGSTLIKAISFAGHEKTYQSWYGLTMDQLKENRRQNPYTYENEIDNYKQDHYQLHWNEKINNFWSFNLGLNYTYGRGYFEQYREDDNIDTYGGIVSSDTNLNGEKTDTTDLIRRRWLDNDFYVFNSSLNFIKNKIDLTISSSYSSYVGDHFGEVIWARTFSSNGKIRDRYYEGLGEKKDLSFFTKLLYSIDEKIEFYSDLQYRNVKYNTSGTTSDLVNMVIDKSYGFFNPKIGLSYKLNPNSLLYVSYARANREPNRTDYESNPDIQPERLNDIEFGWRLRNKNMSLNLNSYFMLYDEQLVLTGEIDDVGNPKRTNSGSSYRIGLEIENRINISELFSFETNLTLSSNKNKNIFSMVDGALYNYGKTNISFSPSFVGSNAIIYQPSEKISLSLLSKYVGKQYMGNTDQPNSILESYFVNDINITYSIKPEKIFQSVSINFLINNILNKEYISNGYYYTYDDTWSVPGQIKTLDGAGYYPQATRNFLAGLVFEF
jgi:iron complex outermembrane receptor protein|tara:strand:- start:48 stop:2207 length:2160 start_codon:yes stop_codon:yes gene_type:complete